MKRKRIARIFCMLTVNALLVGCNPQWEKRDPLEMGQIEQPMPDTSRTSGAIYSPGTTTYLYGSSRAHRVGDLLTIHVNENLNAQDNVTSNTSRKSEITDTFGLTGAVNPGVLQIKGDNKYNGAGNSVQSNTITGDIAVTVVRVLSNGNLVIRGYKTLTLMNGIEKIGLAGIVRQQDINSEDNSVLSSKIANARVVYLGRGQLNDGANKGWLSSVYSGPAWPV